MSATPLSSQQRIILRVEQLAIFLASLYFFSLVGYSWWLYVVLWILPDIGMIGYLANPKVGAAVYNLFHFQGIAWGLILLGMLAGSQLSLLAGAIMLGHSSLDRVLGFGLKHDDEFKHTHLSA